MAGRLGSVDEDEVTSMDRPALLQLVAKGMTAKAEGEKAAAANVTVRSPPGKLHSLGN